MEVGLGVVEEGVKNRSDRVKNGEWLMLGGRETARGR